MTDGGGRGGGGGVPSAVVYTESMKLRTTQRVCFVSCLIPRCGQPIVTAPLCSRR